jgi:hypothetical protein
MALTDYQIAVYDPSTGEQLDLIDARRIQKLEYSRVLNDTSGLSLTLMPNDRAQNLLSRTNLILIVYRANNGNAFSYEDAFLTRYWQVSQKQDLVDFVMVGARHLLELFKYRLIVPEDDPNGANGFSTKSGIADLVMLDFVDNQTINPATNIDRIIPNLTNAPSSNLGQPVAMREQYTSLLDVLQRASVLGNIDFKLFWTSGNNFKFEVLSVGRNLTVSANYPFAQFLLFTPERRNLQNPEYTINRYDEITVTYVAAQGIEEDRIIIPISSPNIYLPLNRRENTIDQRQIEEGSSFLDAITTSASAELRNKQPQIQFTFDADVFASGSRYNVDWQLGDRVTAQYLNYTQDLRITEVKIEVSNTQEIIDPTFIVETS